MREPGRGRKPEQERERLPYRPCAGIVLVNGEGLIFAGERIDTPGAWQMPQGGMDEGETPLETALRELEEEIGVPHSAVAVLGETEGWLTYDLPDRLLGKVWKGKYRGQKQKWFLMRLEGPDSLIDLNVKHPEFSAWRWITADALLDGIVSFKRAIYERIVEELLPEKNRKSL